MEEKEVFQDIEFSNVIKPKPLPDKINDIDTHNTIYTNIIDAQEKGELDNTAINSFTNISRSRDEVYNLLDMMAEDSIISSALDIYAADICEPNDEGRILWPEGGDENCLGAVNQILDALNVDKNIYDQAYALCKYGDIYLKLYRNSEFNFENVKEEAKKLNESYDKLSEKEKKALEESIILRMYSKNDRYAEYAEMESNPAEVFDLIRFGKTCGFIKTDIPEKNPILNEKIPVANWTNTYRYSFNNNDINIYGATEYVHGTIDNGHDRIKEEINLTSKDDQTGIENTMTFKVRRGKSVLYDSFKTWRELSLLENSVVLNRLTKSSILRTINVEVGDMGKTEVQTLLRRIKTLIEQKTSYNVNSSIQEYTNPGPIENVLYFPTHDGKGQVTTDQIGGDVNVGDLIDLNYWKKKLFASLGIPGQYLGDTDDSTGFNGGTSLSLISSRYAKTIKRIQNALIQMYTDAVNLILLDRGLSKYINKFSLKMQAPTTQEEKDRKDNLSNSINIVREIMGLLDPIEDSKVRLEILKSLLSDVITNEEVIGFIQDEIDKLEKSEEEELTDVSGSDTDIDLDFDLGSTGGEDLGDFDTLETDTGLESEPLDLGTETEIAAGEEEAPLEAFYTNNGGEVLNEQNDLPSFSELGVSFTDVR